MCRLSLQEHPASDRPDELSVPRLHFPAHGHNGRATLLLPALVSVVVDVRVAALLGERAAIPWIVDHEIGITAELDRALSGIESEQLGRLRRAGVNHCLKAEASGGDATGVHEINALLHRRDAVRDPGERVPAHALLIAVAEGG